MCVCVCVCVCGWVDCDCSDCMQNVCQFECFDELDLLFLLAPGDGLGFTVIGIRPGATS